MGDIRAFDGCLNEKATYYRRIGPGKWREKIAQQVSVKPKHLILIPLIYMYS